MKRHVTAFLAVILVLASFGGALASTKELEPIFEPIERTEMTPDHVLSNQMDSEPIFTPILPTRSTQEGSTTLEISPRFEPCYCGGRIVTRVTRGTPNSYGADCPQSPGTTCVLTTTLIATKTYCVECGEVMALDYDTEYVWEHFH